MSLNEFNVLLIDDDEDEFFTLRDLCSEISISKYNISWQHSYQKGVEALANGQYDACLLDYRLGAKTGLELLQECKTKGIRTPIIFLTGQGDLNLDLQAMQMGASDYLVKSQLNPHLLERALRYSIKHEMDMEELRSSKEQILQQDRLASLGLLASSLAHEIGTPMGIIRSRAEMIEKKQSENEPLKKDMGIIISQIDRISKLVNSLLHLARGNQSGSVTDVNLTEVLTDILNLFEHELARKKIDLSVSLKENCFVKAEGGPLTQVLLNLLVNSVHAIEESRKDSKTDKHQISIQILDETSYIKIVVTDNGAGISAANQSQIFKPFFTTKDVGSGSGLGLATSFKLVHSWGGSISFKSEDSNGTAFTLKLLKAR